MPVLLAAATARGASQKPTVESIGNQVMCLCGCVATLNHCPHVNCAMKAEMLASIRQEIAAGKDETTILQDLAIKYGVKVLAAPPKKGFDLAVWILPGIGLLAGLAFAIVLVRRWRSPSRAPSAGAAAIPPVDPEVLVAVEKEMETTGLGRKA
jgi:cytochrome c-type biogenesis protein CcmH/NrfF